MRLTKDQISVMTVKERMGYACMYHDTMYVEQLKQECDRRMTV